MNITARSSKADIIDAALELTESQAGQISELKQQQVLLLILLGFSALCQLL